MDVDIAPRKAPLQFDEATGLQLIDLFSKNMSYDGKELVVTALTHTESKILEAAFATLGMECGHDTNDGKQTLVVNEPVQSAQRLHEAGINFNGARYLTSTVLAK